MVSSAFGPNPFSVRIRCSSAAVRSASSESIWSSSNSRRARLGPSPGSRVISISPGGNLARSFTAAGIAPSSASASTFSWMIAPIPGSSVARPWRASAVTDTDASRTALAALRYATMRWMIAPSSSYRSPSSSSAAAISVLVGSAIAQRRLVASLRSPDRYTF